MRRVTQIPLVTQITYIHDSIYSWAEWSQSDRPYKVQRRGETIECKLQLLPMHSHYTSTSSTIVTLYYHILRYIHTTLPHSPLYSHCCTTFSTIFTLHYYILHYIHITPPASPLYSTHNRHHPLNTTLCSTRHHSAWAFTSPSCFTRFVRWILYGWAPPRFATFETLVTFPWEQ